MRKAALGVVPAVLFVLLPPQDPVAHAQMLQQAQQLARTYEPHQRLQQLAGAWDVAVRTTVPGQPEVAGRGSLAGKSMLGGRYVVLNFQLDVQGAPLEAVQILGFDNLRQSYTSSWRDDLSTWSVECAGGAEPKEPTKLRLAGQLADAHDPAGRPFRLELDLPALDQPKGAVQVRLYDTIGGREVLVQRQDWTRR
jgi:hypothetical protein